MKGGKQTEVDEGREHGRRMERQGQAERTSRRRRLKPRGLPFQMEEHVHGSEAGGRSCLSCLWEEPLVLP